VLEVLGPATGGIRRHVAALADGLERRGWVVEVAGPHGVMEGLRSLDHALPITRQPRSAVAAIARLRTLASTVDLVHAHGLTAGWLSSCAVPRTPLVVTIHNVVLDEVEGRWAPLLRKLEDRLPQRADAVIAISNSVARRFSGLRGSDRFVVVPPVSPGSLSTRPAHEMRAELGVPTGSSLVLLVGRLHPQKDIPNLLEAAARLRPAHPDLVVAIAGGGPQRAALEGRVRSHGLDSTVQFLGQRSDVPDLMAAADVVVMCSIWEGHGLVVGEALSLGRPLVATAVGPVADLVMDGVTGRLVPPADPPALAAAIGDLLDDPLAARRMGQAGAERMQTTMSPDALVDQVAEVYRRLLEAKP